MLVLLLEKDHFFHTEAHNRKQNKIKQNTTQALMTIRYCCPKKTLQLPLSQTMRQGLFLCEFFFPG